MLRIVSIIYIIINNIFILFIIIFGKRRVQKWNCPICFCPICPICPAAICNILIIRRLKTDMFSIRQFGHKQIGQIALFLAIFWGQNAIEKWKNSKKMPYFRLSMTCWKWEKWQGSFNLIENFKLSTWLLWLKCHSSFAWRRYKHADRH